jgi:hypothetical protein
MSIKDEDMAAAHKELTASTNEKQINVTAEITCMLNGALIGAAAVLVLNANERGQSKTLEASTIRYFTSYINGLVQQGLTRDALGFLWSQMGVAAQANEHNTVQKVANHLLGAVLKTGTVVKQN